MIAADMHIWAVMRDELVALIAQNSSRLRPYFFNKTMSFPPRHWKTMELYFWCYKTRDNCRACPATMRIMRAIPGMPSCSLSILEPGSNINPHQGDTDAIYRCQRRLIMIVDVVRPEYLDQQNRICAHVLASSLLQMLYQSLPFLNSWPGRVKQMLYGMLRSGIRVYLLVQRRFG